MLLHKCPGILPVDNVPFIDLAPIGMALRYCSLFKQLLIYDVPRKDAASALASAVRVNKTLTRLVISAVSGDQDGNIWFVRN